MLFKLIGNGMAEENQNNGYTCPARPEPQPNEADYENYVFDMLDRSGYIAPEDGVRDIIRTFRQTHNL